MFLILLNTRTFYDMRIMDVIPWNVANFDACNQFR